MRETEVYKRLFGTQISYYVLYKRREKKKKWGRKAEERMER